MFVDCESGALVLVDGLWIAPSWLESQPDKWQESQKERPTIDAQIMKVRHMENIGILPFGQGMPAAPVGGLLEPLGRYWCFAPVLSFLPTMTSPRSITGVSTALLISP
jgi:hypothetical protein